MTRWRWEIASRIRSEEPSFRNSKTRPFRCSSANLVVKRGGLPEVVKPFVTLSRGGRKIAIFGLTNPITRPQSGWARVTSFVFEDPVEVARRLAPELKREAELVICLSHCGLQGGRGTGARAGSGPRPRGAQPQAARATGAGRSHGHRGGQVRKPRLAHGAAESRRRDERAARPPALDLPAVTGRSGTESSSASAGRRDFTARSLAFRPQAEFASEL